MINVIKLVLVDYVSKELYVLFCIDFGAHILITETDEIIITKIAGLDLMEEAKYEFNSIGTAAYKSSFKLNNIQLSNYICNNLTVYSNFLYNNIISLNSDNQYFLNKDEKENFFKQLYKALEKKQNLSILEKILLSDDVRGFIKNNLS